MTISGFNRYALSCAVVALLAGRGGSQAPIGAPGAMPQTPAVTAHAGRGTSWMLPEAPKSDLAYIDYLSGYVWAFTYPGGKYVGSISVGSWGGLCAAKTGNWWVAASAADDVLEYAHGGTTPSLLE